jgi:hypothetical protein
MNYLDSIQSGLEAKKKHIEIARKIFLTHPTNAFRDKEEKQFEILNEVSDYFKIPITNIQVVGSSKIGQSFHKKTVFSSGTSDLDLAIIDSNLFVYYTELIYSVTKGFSDLTKFSRNQNGVSNYVEYSQYLLKGIFRADLMPTAEIRAQWTTFFGKLSAKHTDLFKSINAGIYLSQRFFEIKQTSTIRNYIKLKNGGL